MTEKMTSHSEDTVDQKIQQREERIRQYELIIEALERDIARMEDEIRALEFVKKKGDPYP